MKVEQLVPHVLSLGTPVFYSHRAASVKRAIDTSDGGRQVAQDYGVISTADACARGRVPAGLSAPDVANVLPNPSPPRRCRVRPAVTIDETTYPAHVGEPYELDRWVYVWPEEGQGRVVGLVFRQEGRWDSEREDGEYGSGGYVTRYLTQTEAWPLYQVKARLTGKAILVPVWAACPIVDVGDRFVRNEGFVAEMTRTRRAA